MSIHGVYAEENMDNISDMTPVNIFKNPKIVKNIFIEVECSHDEITQYTTLFKKFLDVFAWYYGEIPDIDPRIVQHGIRTYENVKPV